MLERFSIEMTEPQYMRITGYPRAWSPPIASPLAGTPIVVEVKSKDDFEKYRGKLRGAIVMNGRPESAGHRLSAGGEAADRRGAEETGEADRSGGRLSSAARRNRTGTKKTSWQKTLEKQTRDLQVLREGRRRALC